MKYISSGNKAILLLIAFMAGCGGGNGDLTRKGDFRISGLGVNIAAYDPATGKAGDFIFAGVMDAKVFLEFGADAGGRLLPTFEYRLDPNADVMAISEGTVIWMRYQADTSDYEIATRSTLDPDFYVFYDHVKSPTVSDGEQLLGGQVLGKPGSWSATLGRFEIMINNNRTGLSYCPFVYFEPGLMTEYEQKITQLMQDWEAYKSNTGIYDEASQV